jgi:hypothetical protein
MLLEALATKTLNWGHDPMVKSRSVRLIMLCQQILNRHPREGRSFLVMFDRSSAREPIHAEFVVSAPTPFLVRRYEVGRGGRRHCQRTLPQLFFLASASSIFFTYLAGFFLKSFRQLLQQSLTSRPW